jgi:hypothetical protein
MPNLNAYISKSTYNMMKQEIVFMENYVKCAILHESNKSAGYPLG